MSRAPVQVNPVPAPAPGDLPEALVAPTATIDAYLRECVESLSLPPNLRDAVLYALLGPGKRVRPLLVWHAFHAAGGSPAIAARCLPAAAALEMVHAFSLVHDDLPGLDNDDLRRGRPTLHRHTSEPMAILAGDCLLTSAFHILVDRVDDPALQARLVREIAVGTNAMIVGQVFDTLGGMPDSASGVERLELVHRNKTGMLIRAACRMGAMCVGPSLRPAALDAITAYADAIGLMFQVVDDLLDVTQSTAHLGKKSGKDEDAGKLTYPGLLGVERSRAEVARLQTLSLNALAPLDVPAEPLRQLCLYLATRTR